MCSNAVNPRPPAASSPSEGDDRVWLVVNEADTARLLKQAMVSAGLHDAALLTDVASVQRRLAERGAPELLVMGLRFPDGDGFQLMRMLARLPRPPAVYVASWQQRAVIKTAANLAAACGLSLAGTCELPAETEAVVRDLQAWQPAAPAPAPAAPKPRPVELSREALLSLFDRDVLQPWMQPKLRLATGEIVGFEALMRARDTEGRVVMPDRLVSGLQRHHLLDAATLHMARRTVDFVATCLAEGIAVSTSINVSMQSLSNVAFCQELAAAVEARQLDPSWITIEITETDAMADIASVIENSGRIRMLGFNLAIDDFGTAYSSLFQLSRIPFSELKVERAFVSGIGDDRGKQGIVRACAMLGHSLGLHVVAEGVETMDELEAVRAAGCTEVQGFLVARPMPAEQALAWLRALPDQRFVPSAAGAPATAAVATA